MKNDKEHFIRKFGLNFCNFVNHGVLTEVKLAANGSLVLNIRPSTTFSSDFVDKICIASLVITYVYPIK